MLTLQSNDRLQSVPAESQHSSSTSQTTNDDLEEPSSSDSTDVETAAKPSTKSR